MRLGLFFLGWGGARGVGMGGLCWVFVGVSNSECGAAIDPYFLRFRILTNPNYLKYRNDSPNLRSSLQLRDRHPRFFFSPELALKK